MNTHSLPLWACALTLATASGCSSPEPKEPSAPPPPPPARHHREEFREIQSLEDRRGPISALDRFLVHEDSVVRSRALLALGRVGDPSAIPAAVRSLTDREQRVVEDAIFALGLIGAPAIFDTLAPKLEDPDPEVRALALQAISRIGDPAHASYAAARVADRSATVRAEVGLALWRMSEKATTEDQKSRVRAEIAKLRPLLTDPDLSVRWRTCCALARLDASPLAPDLERAATDQDPLVRTFAIRALGKVTSHPAATFVKAIGDPDPRVVWEVVEALASRDGDEVGAALEEAARGGEAVTVARALELLAQKGRAPEAAIRMASKHPSPGVRGAAVAAAAWMRDPKALETAKKALGSPDAAVRAGAARALVVMVGSDAEAELSKVLSGSDRMLHLSVLGAIQAVAKMRPDRVREWDALIRQASAIHDLSVSGTVLDLLEGRTEPEWDGVVEAIWHAARGREMADVRVMALAWLESVKRGEGLAREGLGDAVWEVRAQAAKTLKAATGEDSKVEAAAKAEIRPSAVEEFVRPPVIRIETTRGTIRIRLLPDAAPCHATAIVRLIREKFYDGKVWHRVVPNFVIQGGDPRGDGWGDAGFVLRDEVSREPYEAGTVGMAKGGKDTGSCQLFITSVPTPHLDGRYTVFGRVIEGIEVVRAIEVGDLIRTASVEP
jgi:cyclophilin family peptidyl-prolyl cis-trans isomerase